MSSPDTVAVSPDGTRLYVTENVKVLELASGSYPSGEFYYDDQGRLWVVVDNYSAVSVIDTATDTESAMVPVSGASNVTVSPDGSRAYVTGSDGKTVTVIDTRTNTLIGTLPPIRTPPAIPVTSPPLAPAMAPSTSRIRVITRYTSPRSTHKRRSDPSPRPAPTR
ncbi:MAG: YncE family protein [Candidatus Sericytochromatia bacterium]